MPVSGAAGRLLFFLSLSLSPLDPQPHKPPPLLAGRLAGVDCTACGPSCVASERSRSFSEPLFCVKRGWQGTCRARQHTKWPLVPEGLASRGSKPSQSKPYSSRRGRPAGLGDTGVIVTRLGWSLATGHLCMPQGFQAERVLFQTPNRVLLSGRPSQVQPLVSARHGLSKWVFHKSIVFKLCVREYVSCVHVCTQMP